MSTLGVVGSSLENCIAQINQLLTTSGPILIVGEPGSGKDFLVRMIHKELLEKPDHKLQIQNCARPQQTLLEELYGYVNNDESNIWDNNEVVIFGKLDLANQGTLYLDHIHLLPPDGTELIAAILSAQPFYPKGAKNPRYQDNIRIIASCIPHPFEGALGYLPRKLQLYFSNRYVVVPNLSQRKDEIETLMNYFCKFEFVKNQGDVPVFSIDQEFIEKANHIIDNIRGLKAIAKRFADQNPRGGNITWMLASEYIEKKIQQQSLEEQRKHRCQHMSIKLRYQGELLNGERLYSWLEQFNNFRGQISYNPIDIAETILKNICEKYFITESRLITLLESMHEELITEIIKDISKTKSSVERSRFTPEAFDRNIRNEAVNLASKLIVTIPLGPLKSSDAVTMEYGISINNLGLKYRKVAKLIPKINACEFEKLGEWYSKQTSPARVIILDDFLGSGSQFETLVQKIITNQNLYTAYENHRHKPEIKIYILICVAYRQGIERALKYIRSIPKWLDIKIICGEILENKDRVFRAESSIFPEAAVRQDAEKLVVDLIGKKIYPIAPRGYDDLESIIVFEHNIPNDSLPILYVNRDSGPLLWRAIFHRMRTS